MTRTEILVVGVGELGEAMIKAFLQHHAFKPEEASMTALLRPSTIANPSSSKAAQIASLAAQGVNVIPGDLEVWTVDEIATTFQPYHTIIHSGAMTLSPGTQLKVTKAVLASGTNKLYIPWQFGVDYDVTGRTGGQGLFSEQVDVRDLLRSQNDVSWVIVSNGIFMSFLFEGFWGVVVGGGGGGGDGGDDGNNKKMPKVEKVRALGSWNDLLTVTTAEDIARCTAEVVLVDKAVRNQCIYISGDSLTYDEFANVVERRNGFPIERELWTTDYLIGQSKADLGNKLLKYRVVFSEGVGLAWPKENTYNERKGIKMTSVDEYLTSL